jgi:hypothetical protein
VYIGLSAGIVAALVALGPVGAREGLILLYGCAAVGIVALVVASVCRPASVEEVDEFAKVSVIETTPASQRFIAYYLVTGRRLRTVLVLAATFLPSLVGYALGLTDGSEGIPSSWQAVLAASLLGTIWAELALTRPTGQVRVASLRPRDTASYLGRPLRWSPSIVGGVAAAGWAGVSAMPATRPNGMARASRDEIVVGIVFGLAVPALVALTQRWIVSRPQPFVVSSLVDADDAIRAASIRYLAAVGTAMALLNLAGAAVQYTYRWNGTADILTGGTVLVSISAAWFYWNARKPGVLMRPSRPLRPSPAS